jgi:nitrite reductase (NADH) large subunit
LSLDSAASLLADGTYAITPRMYGGVTNAEQLRLLADVIDKYRIPLVKLTGGAHLDLLGIAEEQVKAIGSGDWPPGIDCPILR